MYHGKRITLQKKNILKFSLNGHKTCSVIRGVQIISHERITPVGTCFFQFSVISQKALFKYCEFDLFYFTDTVIKVC